MTQTPKKDKEPTFNEILYAAAKNAAKGLDEETGGRLVHHIMSCPDCHAVVRNKRAA